MKIKYKNFHGEWRETTLGDELERRINMQSCHGYGQLEDLTAQLSETKRIIGRLGVLLQDSLSPEEILYLCTGSRDQSSFSDLRIEESDD